LKYEAATTYTLNDNFRISINANNISIPSVATYMSHAILGICTAGNAVIKVYLHEYRLEKDNLLVILPGQVAALKEKSEDFRINYYLLTKGIINDTVTGISRLSPLFFIHMRRKYLYQLNEEEVYRYKEYYNVIYSRLVSNNQTFQEEFIINVLRLFYLDLYNNYKNNLLATDQVSERRKEQLAYNFFLLILDNYKEHKEVAFYADKMYITPKYLSSVIKEVSDRSAKDWITEYVLMEIKSLLKNSAFNIQEITAKTNFSNQASLGRFFRKHTGMSPSEYRTSGKDD